MWRGLSLAYRALLRERSGHHVRIPDKRAFSLTCVNRSASLLAGDLAPREGNAPPNVTVKQAGSIICVRPGRKRRSSRGA